MARAEERGLPVEFEIDHQKRFVYARTEGVVVLQEILDYFDAVTLQNAASYPKLFDAREGTPQLSDDDVMVLGARVSAYAAFDPRGAVAAVATTDEARDGVRRYMNFAGAQRAMRLFASIEDARAWLLSDDSKS
jgi:hypothetical protein